MDKAIHISRFINSAAALCILLSLFGFGVSSAWPWQYDFLRHIGPSSYPSAHCVLSKEIEHIEVKRDGTYYDRDEVFITVLDKKGEKGQQVQHFFLNRNYSRLDIRKMEVIKPDGRSFDVDLRKNSSLTDPSSASRMNIYDPSRKVLNIFIPDLNPGDTIHYIVEIDNFKPMIEGHFFGRSLIQQTFPVKSIKLEMELPGDMPLHYLIKDRCIGAVARFRKTSSGDLIKYSWTFENIPELVPEPYMPEIQRAAMRLLFSTLPSWKDASKWYFNLVEPKLETNDAIRSEVASLVAGKQEEKERLEAIFFFVARKIRYLGIIEEADRPGFEPHEVSLTFERKSGVCRDKAALPTAMLREAGFKAVPVIISAGSKLDPEIAVPYFNHAIVAVLDVNGRPKVYMDPTSETSRQFLPDYEQDSSCLPAVSQGSDLLLTPVKNPGSNLFTMVIRDRLDMDGALRGELKAGAAGFADTALRSVLMRKSRDEQERFLKVFLLKRQPRLKIQEISWTDPGDSRKNFSFQCRFALPGALRESGEFFPFSAARTLGLMDSWLLKRASMIERRYPLKMGYTFESLVKETMEINVPYCRISLPETTDIDNGFFSYKTSYSITKDGAAVDYHFSIKRLEIPPDKYPDLLQIQAIQEASPFNSMILSPCRQE